MICFPCLCQRVIINVMTRWYDSWLCEIRKKCIRRVACGGGGAVVFSFWYSGGGRLSLYSRRRRPHRPPPPPQTQQQKQPFATAAATVYTLQLPPPPPPPPPSYLLTAPLTTRISGATPPVNTVVWLVTVNNRSAVGGLVGGNPRGRVVVGNAFRVVSVVHHPSEKVHRVSFFMSFDPAQPLNSPFFL